MSVSLLCVGGPLHGRRRARAGATLRTWTAHADGVVRGWTYRVKLARTADGRFVFWWGWVMDSRAPARFIRPRS